MKNICRDCKGVNVEMIFFENSHWCYDKIGCPLGGLSIKQNSFTKTERLKIFKEKCANEKALSLNEPGRL